MKSPRRTGKVKSSRVSSSAAREELMRGLRFDSRSVVLGVLVLVGILSLYKPVQVLLEQRQQISDQQALVDQAKQDLIDMQVERKRWEDPVYIRSQARDRLYYVMPGEVSYLVMDASGIDQSDKSGTVGAMIAARTNNGAISKNVRTTNDNWVDAVVETFVRAGIEEPVATKDGQ